MSSILVTEADSDDGELRGTVYDEEATVRIIADEEGVVRNGIGRWLNSARITVDPDKDEVNCVVSVGDPRGGFVFTVRRLDDGTIVLHTPHPGEGFAHMKLKQDHPGTYVVVGDRGEPLTLEDEDQLDREDWREGWTDMSNGESELDDEDADTVFGIRFNDSEQTWSVIADPGKRYEDIRDEGFESAEDAAEKAEELDEEENEDKEQLKKQKQRWRGRKKG